MKAENLILEEFQKKQKDLFSRLEDEGGKRIFYKKDRQRLTDVLSKTGEPLKEDELKPWMKNQKKRRVWQNASGQA